MSALEHIVSVVDKIGDIATGIQTKLSYFVGLGLISCSGLAWSVYSAESLWWWNAVKCGLLLLPALIWIFVWFVLGQLREAPNLVSELAQDEDGVLANMQDLSLKEPNGLRGVFSTVRAFRKEEGLSVVFDTISGVTLIANPLFAIIAFLSSAILMVLILIAPFVLLF